MRPPRPGGHWTRYQDRDELRRLRMDELRAKVAAGIDSLDRGEGVDGDAVIDEILADGPRVG